MEVAFQSKILRRKRRGGEYKVYRAALEWDLEDPILLESRDDFRSEDRWKDVLTPYHHQVTNLITFCRRLPVTLLADDVGLGKTISSGLVISELVARARVQKILIVCPKILGQQWKEELETKFKIDATVVAGKELLEADPDDVGAVITTYHTARMYLDRIPRDRFGMLILDEAHKLRNLYGVPNPPQVAKVFRTALEERRWKYVLMLTATPIQNRLWDIYSLIDLLTVARGHDNPFGSEGMFARKFIADARENARRLRLDAKDEFRSIVYGYMSRVRRDDAKLYFPDRKVMLRRVQPTEAELLLFKIVGKAIQELNILTQISILQALVSSPDALLAQLRNMATKGTVPASLRDEVESVVKRMPTIAKLRGLDALVRELSAKDLSRWRLVVFTTRRETQTTIQNFLEARGLRVGIINGSTGGRNQETLKDFRNNPPHCHVIVSTEAGSEGLNLQVANVLVNFDLPWNPMIVEQRIGRIQRLASEHKNVAIFNVVLQDTFEEYIVGRLMEKLQLASHAIGDVDALLEASGLSDEDTGQSFQEKIRQLVVAALAGKDVETATRMAEKSIEDAATELERERDNINDMLGSMNGAEYAGPSVPKLPEQIRSMSARDFVLAAFMVRGANVSPHSAGVFLVESGVERELVTFNEQPNSQVRATHYSPGTSSFEQLVTQIGGDGIHDVRDADSNTSSIMKELTQHWVSSFGGRLRGVSGLAVRRYFEGKALVRVRVTTAHDSYERLVEIQCEAGNHNSSVGKAGLAAVPHVIDDPSAIGIDMKGLEMAALSDPAISEFSRFYLERREQEIVRAGDDERKRQKLQDEFTPRTRLTLVGLEGSVHRQLDVAVSYSIDGIDYDDSLTMVPSAREMLNVPERGTCAVSGRTVPIRCLARCDVSGKHALRHLLIASESSGRRALPAYGAICSLTGKKVLNDEVSLSDLSGQPVLRGLMKTCAITGKNAEPSCFARCEFTGVDALKSSLLISDVSGSLYRADEQATSALSEKSGHKSEFVTCYETRQCIALSEAEKCQATGKLVRPGILQPCAVTRQKVLPSQLDRCGVTGQRALRQFFVASSVSRLKMLEKVAVSSSSGTYCSPKEVKTCRWSGESFHPDDLLVCELAKLPIHFQFATPGDYPRLRPLVELLSGSESPADASQHWERLSADVAAALKGGRAKVEAAISSPDGKLFAASVELRTRLGFKIEHVGAVYSIEEGALVGRLARGKRTENGWILS